MEIENQTAMPMTGISQLHSVKDQSKKLKIVSNNSGSIKDFDELTNIDSALELKNIMEGPKMLNEHLSKNVMCLLILEGMDENELKKPDLYKKILKDIAELNRNIKKNIQEGSLSREERAMNIVDKTVKIFLKREFDISPAEQPSMQLTR